MPGGQTEGDHQFHCHQEQVEPEIAIGRGIEEYRRQKHRDRAQPTRRRIRGHSDRAGSGSLQTNREPKQQARNCHRGYSGAGHGIVELTAVLRYSYDAPRVKIIRDVGRQVIRTSSWLNKGGEFRC